MVFRVPAFIERKLACFGSSESLLIRHVLLFIGVFGVDDDDLGLHVYSEILRSLGHGATSTHAGISAKFGARWPSPIFLASGRHIHSVSKYMLQTPSGEHIVLYGAYLLPFFDHSIFFWPSP